MKTRRIITALIVILSVGTFGARAEEKDGPGPWSVGMSYRMTIGDRDKHDDSYADFKGFSVDGAYRLMIYKSFMFHPGASLYYDVHGPDPKRLGGYPPRIKEFGLGIKLPIGLEFKYYKATAQIETGPTASIYLWQKYHTGGYVHGDGTPLPKYTSFDSNRFMLRWMFGLGMNFFKERIYVKANFELPMTYEIRDEKLKGNYVFSAGIGYNF